MKKCFGTMDCGTLQYDGCNVPDLCEEKHEKGGKKE